MPSVVNAFIPAAITAIFPCVQIKNNNIKENSFWAKAKEEKFEKDEVFEALSKTFAAKAVAKKAINTEVSGNTPAKSSKKKARALKVLDPKSAQNLCKFI